MNIIVSITPHEDGVRCGECFFEPLCPWVEMVENDGHFDSGHGHECHAAEKKLRDLVEAGTLLYHGDSAEEEWEIAIAAIAAIAAAVAEKFKEEGA